MPEKITIDNLDHITGCTGYYPTFMIQYIIEEMKLDKITNKYQKIHGWI